MISASASSRKLPSALRPGGASLKELELSCVQLLEAYSLIR